MQKSVEVSYNKSTDFANAFPYFPGNTVPVQYTAFQYDIVKRVSRNFTGRCGNLRMVLPLSMESDCTRYVIRSRFQ